MLKKTTYPNVGYLYAIVSAVLFGSSTPAAKYLINEISPLLLAGLLYLGAGLGLSIILIRQQFISKTLREPSLLPRDYKLLASATLFGGILGPALLMFGLIKTQAATASLLLNLESLFTALIAWIFIKEHTDKRLIFGMLLILIGSIILVWQRHLIFSNLIGPSLIAGACIAWAIDNNVTRKISAADPLKIVLIKSLVAGSFNVTLALLLGATLANKLSILSLSAVIGFLGYGLSIIYFILALRYIGTARTSAYFSIAPFVGASFSIFFLGESLSLQLIMAGILMGLGIWLHLTERHLHKHRHEFFIHEHMHYHDEHHQHEHLTSDLKESHSHLHIHAPLLHSHPHYPDIHHRHKH
jgi:drug/metabolite transporter (DMT)-like permease